jgi:DNA primase
MNFAEHLKGQLNIVEVVQQYVSLKRQGSGQKWKGLCPFHSEKTPSFNVDGLHQFYHCFGCDAGGDVFHFVQQIESLTFVETLRLLAERYGIPMPERQRNDDPEAQRYAALLEIHEEAASIFQNNLRGSPGSEARRYLESRGVSQDAMREFRLGLAEASGQQLAQKLKKYGEDLLIESGLVVKRTEGSGVYDRFRGRLMFPIHNSSGKVIAFGGRALGNDEKVKYLNSPDTRLYAKSSVLYNLHRAKIAARKSDCMILVEGYMDAIGVYSAGIEEVVALCGTALGPKQIRAMKQEISYQSGGGHIVLNLDSDAAGSKSTEKHISALLAQGLRVRVLEIPGTLDPDEYIKENGADAYRRLLERAPSYFHWLTEYARSKFDMRTAEGRVDAFKFMLPSITRVHDRIERGAIATEVAEQLGVGREVVQQILRPKSESAEVARPRDFSAAVPPNEKLLIGCMLASANARAVVRHYLKETDGWEMLEWRPIFQAILAPEEAGNSFSLPDAVSGLEARAQRIVSEISFSESAVGEEKAAEQALDCLKLLEAKSCRVQRDNLKKKIRELEAQGNLAEAIRLTNELDGMGGPSSRV